MNKQETPRKLWVVNYEERFPLGTAVVEPNVTTEADVTTTAANAASVGAAASVEPTVTEPKTPADVHAYFSVTTQVETPA
jgi:hypothetical protein